jgi:hypothetical protein
MKLRLMLGKHRLSSNSTSGATVRGRRDRIGRQRPNNQERSSFLLQDMQSERSMAGLLGAPAMDAARGEPIPSVEPPNTSAADDWSLKHPGNYDFGDPKSDRATHHDCERSLRPAFVECNKEMEIYGHWKQVHFPI